MIEVEYDDEEMELIRGLTEGRFFEVLEGDQLERFNDFLDDDQSIIVAGGFLLSYPLTEGGKVWFHYEYVQSDDDSLIFKSPTVLIPENPVDSSVPEDYENYPKFDLGETVYLA